MMILSMKRMLYPSVIFQAKTQFTKTRESTFPRTQILRKKNIWHEKAVTSTYFEINENELTTKLQFPFTFSAHLIENEATPDMNVANEMS